MNNKKIVLKNITSSRQLGILIVLVAMMVVLTISSENFLTFNNLLNVLQQAALKGVLAIGMTFVIIMGGIDLSVGSMASLSAMFAADIMVKGGAESIPFAIAAAVISGLLCGLFNGFLIATFKVQPFLITMGTLNLYRGIDYIYSNALSIRGMPQEWLQAWNGDVPVPLLILVIFAVIAFLVIRYTKFGRYIFAIGGNETATELSGINVKRIKISTYTLSGLAAAICGIIYVGRLASAEANAGTGYELDAIAAAAIGGASLAGGRGSIAGTMIGAVILAMLANGLTLLNIKAFYQVALTGVIIIVAVLIDKFSNK